MKCICGGKYCVYRTDYDSEFQVVYRYRRCLKCGKKIITAETQINDWNVKDYEKKP